jgi:hypothetical protein
MTHKQSLAQKMKAETNRGKQRLQQKEHVARDESQQRDLKLQDDERKYAPKLFKEVRAKIKKAAAEGNSKTYFQLMLAGDERWPRWASLRAKFLGELLEKAGFKVETESVEDKPFGSDPMYSSTVYHIYINISW